MIELGLSRVFRLLARTPLPWRAIHVAGTNGKGSICAYITGMLSAYNLSQFRSDSGKPSLKHGRFNSPHLIDRWDCITINGETISESIFHQVEGRVKERNIREEIHASEFEILTATAFEIFTHENVDICVIEVGMGGRLDATNILGQLSEWDRPNESGLPIEQFRPKPLVTAVSTIALDHQGFLGSTLEEISTEKAGIMKPGVSVVLAPNDDSVIQNLVRIARDVGVRQTHKLDNDEVRKQNSAMAFSLTWLALQQLNRLQTLDQASLLPLISAFQMVPAKTVWPGRVQDISIEHITGYSPLILIDGAHNAESAEALANTVRKRTGGTRPIIWVIAASQGKDIRSMLKHFLSVQEASRSKTPASVIATRFGPVDGMPWVKSMSPLDILEQVRQVTIVSQDPIMRLTFNCASNDLVEALQNACEDAREKDGLVVVAGSLYLVGDILRMVRDSGGKIA
ncbi:Mur ligase [Delphinella strobiligena]|nr:Mur ligase [Delphinella strobiligena]